MSGQVASVVEMDRSEAPVRLDRFRHAVCGCVLGYGKDTMFELFECGDGSEPAVEDMPPLAGRPERRILGASLD